MKLLLLPFPPDALVQLARIVFGPDPFDMEDEDGRHS